ncbi:hypothetical protein [Microbacterium sp. Clip185]|uniref:hypothetical protein n=1 Tax=Microbacterium sp. Clip185 TaxID=3025663 RepID=UPI00236723A4|nr:hypothetical protein [Microbacterium sp. Clip185]WDG18009.1 hypothetical protein PQV94_15500 [Microbacterium sp. Clip185]
MDFLYRPHPSWLPATYLLLATIALIALPLAVLGRVDEATIVLVGFVYVPFGWAVITVFAAVRIRPRVRFDARRWVGLLALPAWGWSWLWTRFMRLVATHFLRTVIITSIVVCVGVSVGLIAGGISGWIVLVVCILLLGVQIGGVRWANGYTSGYTGGVSVFALAAAGMFVIGCLGWVFALAAGVFFLALPALLAWLVLGALGAPVWLVITAISLALASFVVPFILDLRSGERAGQLPR